MQCLDSLDSEAFFENAEMLYTEPDINVMDHLELKQEPENESNDENETEAINYDDNNSPPAQSSVDKQSPKAEASNSEDSSDVEFRPYKDNGKKKKKPKVLGRKRGRPRKNPLPEVETKISSFDKSNEGLDNAVIKEEMGEDLEIKAENDDATVVHIFIYINIRIKFIYFTFIS